MFQGNFEHTIDDKHRLSIPASFRQDILGRNDDRLSITKATCGVVRCLIAYPYPDWQGVVQDLETLPKFEPKAIAYRAHVFGNAHSCTVDRQGRILITQWLRDHAGLERDVVVSGDGTRFYIWSKEGWLKFTNDVDKNLEKDPEYFAFR
jgi:MraZ protein